MQKPGAEGPSPEVMAMIDQHDAAEDQRMEAKAVEAAKALPELVESAKEMVFLADRIDELESELKDLKARRDHLRESKIPDLMRKAGLVDSKGKGSFTIPGRRIYLETKVHANVAEGNRERFSEWLKKHGFADLLKETVHNATLVSWVKAQREAGKELPPTVSVYEVTVAKAMKAAK